MSAATFDVSSTTAQSLIGLIHSLTGHSNDQPACNWLTVRGDDGNSSTVALGDDSVTLSNYAVLLSATDSRLWSGTSGLNNVDMSTKYVLATTTGQKINLEWELA